MPGYRLRPRAAADLEEIGDYIARDNPRRAESFTAELEDKCRVLGDNPHIGRPRDELRHGLRSFVHGEYVIIYQPNANGVDIVRILHGRRDLTALF
jgi:toxin ParE1/3/4